MSTNDLAAIAAVVSAIAAAASAVAAWRSASVALRVIARDEDSDGDVRRQAQRPSLLRRVWARSRALGVRPPRLWAKRERPWLAFNGLYCVAGAAFTGLGRDTFEGKPCCVLLSNPTTAAAVDIEVEVWCEGALVAHEVINRLEGTARDHARSEIWEGCSFYASWDRVSWQGNDERDYEVIARYRDEKRARVWELRDIVTGTRDDPDFHFLSHDPDRNPLDAEKPFAYLDEDQVSSGRGTTRPLPRTAVGLPAPAFVPLAGDSSGSASTSSPAPSTE